MTSEAVPDASAQTWVNVVYIGETVERLLPFLRTLLDNTRWPLRLVSNGCNRQGLATLEAFSAEHPERVQLLVVSTDRIISHGAVLDRLLEIETSPYFCFVDSDVFATATTDLAALLPRTGEVARSTCIPIWQDEQSLVMPSYNKRVEGMFIRSERGDSLGCTYATTYRTAELRAVIDTHGVGFDAIAWGDLPRDAQIELIRRRLRRDHYDTAKVINVLLESGGRPVVQHEISSLVHVGAWSFRHLAPPGLKRRIGRFARLRAPIVYHVWAISWVVRRGVGFREATDEARKRCRQEKTIEFIEAIEDGTANYDSAPTWMNDRALFETMKQLLGPGRTGIAGDRHADVRGEV